MTTPAQLGAKIGRELLARNVRSAARELEAVLRRRGVRLRPDRTDGMAVLEALLTVPEAEALLDALRRYADALDDAGGDPGREGPPRSRAQKMADVLLDRVLRPGESGLPAVQAQLTVVAPVAAMLGGDQPAEVAGTPVPAELARALARGLGVLPAPAADEHDVSPLPDEASLTEASLTEAGSTDGALAAADEAWWAEVEARTLRGDWGAEEGPPPAELELWWTATAGWSADEEEAFPVKEEIPALGRSLSGRMSRRGGRRRMRPSSRPARPSWRCTGPSPAPTGRWSGRSWPTGPIRTTGNSPQPPGSRRHPTR